MILFISREGLEKMEREKQKQLEREQGKKPNSIPNEEKDLLVTAAASDLMVNKKPSHALVSTVNSFFYNKQFFLFLYNNNKWLTQMTEKGTQLFSNVI